MSAFNVSAHYNVDQNVYSFSYRSESANPLKINMLCLKPGANPATITNEQLADYVAFADDFSVEANGIYESEFSILPGMPEGKYSIWLYTDQYVTPSQPYDTFYYPSSSGIIIMLGEFNADGADYAELFKKYTSQDRLMLEVVNPNDEYYLANMESVNKLFVAHRPFAGCVDIDRAYADAMLTDRINNGDSENIEKIIDSLFEMKDAEAAASYKNDKEAVLRAFIDKKEAFGNTDEAMASFNKITVLTLVNKTKENSKMQNIIKDYAGYIDIDYDKYIKAGANSVNRYLIDKNFETVESIKAAVENGIAAAEENKSSPGSPGNNGGSGKKSESFSIQDTLPGNVNSNVSNCFTDMSSAPWAVEAVNSLAEKGIVSGDGNGLFRPNDSVTREEFLKMLMLALGFECKEGSSSFKDVNPGSWYAPYVVTAHKMGITSGRSDILFGVGESITREEMTVFITRAAAALNKNIAETSAYSSFSDEASISDYALDSVKALKKAGIVTGMENNCFNPSAMSTRAQSAAVIYRTLVSIEKGVSQ